MRMNLVTFVRLRSIVFNRSHFISDKFHTGWEGLVVAISFRDEDDGESTTTNAARRSF